MTAELKERLSKYPNWITEHIKHLEKLPQANIEEIARLQKRVTFLEERGRVLQDRIDAMVNMFQCAAKGENEIAKAVEKIVSDFLTVKEK